MHLILLALAPAMALDLQGAHRDVADEFDVPEKLLLAMSFEASHWQVDAASAWGGYGLLDLREPGETGGNYGPDVEQAALLLGVSPDLLIADPIENLRGGAALLALHGRRSNGGVQPDADDLLAWWDAVVAYSGKHEPNLAALYAEYIYELVNTGVLDEPGLALRPEPVDHWSKVAVPPPASCDYSGCYQFIAASSSNYSNYSRTGSDIDYVVVHTVQGSYSGCISWFQNSSAGVSAHYVVRSSDGQITQMVKEEDVGWHAGNWSYNEASVGIEHEGYVESPDTYYTTAMYSASGALVADIVARTDVTADRSHIIAHSEVPSATHTDPGSGWDWDTYMSYITGGEVTGDLIGVVADTDIYSGERLVGATAWVAETGETTTVDSDGYYRFNDLPLQSYTIYASYSGFETGSCTKDLSQGTNWCSIALEPSSSGGDGGGDDGGTTGDTGSTTGDGGTPDTGPLGDGGAGGDGGSADGDGVGGATPGSLVRADELRGCSSAPGRSSGLGLALLGLLLVRRRGARA